MVILAVVSILSSCSYAQKTSENKKILIVYYSWSEGKNTQAVAQQIQQATGGDIVEIVPSVPYPSDYQVCVDQAKKEIAENYKPALQSKVENIERYDIIFVGTPNWWSTMAPPVAAFLSQYNLAGKTVVPFCTHGGGGKAKCLSDMEALCAKSTVLEGFAIPGNRAKSAQDDVEKWLKEIKIIN
ncbi:MAG: NAD(P)H-dependent oxidoreductase [Bacteroidales bacterium]|nr:NAD(P)H-dependent oxidoreductase [Bacteroidales bacterium]